MQKKKRSNQKRMTRAGRVKGLMPIVENYWMVWILLLNREYIKKII